MLRPHIILILLLFALAGCDLLRQEDPDPPTQYSRRDYVWKVDTLYSPPGGFVLDIWGSSPDNVWAVLSGGISPLWHYDGQEWNEWPRPGPQLNTIFGFAQDDVWMGGNDGKIYHFDGNEWSIQYIYSKDGMQSPNISGIFGTSRSEVYAIGTLRSGNEIRPYLGFILSFDGIQWKERFVADFGGQFHRVRINQNNVFISGFKSNDGGTSRDKRFFYTFANDSLQIIKEIEASVVGSATLNKIGDDILFVMGNTINSYSNGIFSEVHVIQEPKFGYQIYGRNRNDMFLRMSNGLMHFNGNGSQYLFSFTQPSMTINHNAILFDSDVFFIVNDFGIGSNLIHHGTLSD